MHNLIGITKYKCFEHSVAFDSLKRVNIIIGRNNAGKSSILDVIEYLTEDIISSNQIENDVPQVFIKTKITQKIINNTKLSDNRDSTEKNLAFLHGENDTYTIKRKEEFLSFSKPLINLDIQWENSEHPSSSKRFLIKSDTFPNNFYKNKFSKDLLEGLPFVLDNKIFKRVSAERDITPEIQNNNSYKIDSNGVGLTNAVTAYKTISKLSKESGYIIKKKLLPAINYIFGKDGHFIDIECQELETKKWEIYLEEENKTLISLTESGSGLKTIIVVLCFLILVPAIEKKSLENYIFGFEELENNIHPALLRRLSSYIHQLSIEEKFMFFLTTHSSVLIDQFSNKEDAQIVHITQSKGKSRCRRVQTFSQNAFILDDLEVRASDLLQVNGVIWVEGPTDVIYIKKWLELYASNNKKEQFIQGRDFDFHMFGGTLLDSLSLMTSESNEDEELKKLVSMFSFSRNAYVVIDSDAANINNKIFDKSKFAKAKTYIKNQFENLSTETNNLGLWYREGDTDAITIEDYLDIESKHLIDNHSWTKKIAAQKVTKNWNNKNISDFPNNLSDEIEALYKSIKKWNS